MSVSGARPAQAMLPALGLALVLVAANAVKPLTIDDPAYYEIARHLAQNPLDPYGGWNTWEGSLTSQFRVTSPPAFNYWWAGAIALFGESELAWKLSLLPIALLLCWALLRLGRRFAPGLERPLTAIVALSPPILVGFNLMLDVPVLALGLAAAALFVEAVDRRSGSRAVAAGLVAGLALQTKYTAVAIPVAMAIYATQSWRWRELGLAAASTGIVAFGIETLIVTARGESHLLAAMRGSGGELLHLRSVWPLLVLTTEAMPVVLPMALLALGVARRWIALACVLLAGAYVLIAFDLRGFTLPGTAGALTWSAVIAGLVRGVRGGSSDLRRDVAFLGLWLLVEVAIALQTAPFPAVRRFNEAWAVTAILLAVVAAPQVAHDAVRPVMRGLAGFAFAIGTLFAVVDTLEARNQRQAAQEGAARARELTAGTAWFTGWHGFTFYAARSGLRLANGDGSMLRAGDVLVMPLHGGQYQRIVIPKEAQLIEVRQVGTAMPLRTLIDFYSGDRAIDHNPPNLRGIELRLYRLGADASVLPQ